MKQLYLTVAVGAFALALCGPAEAQRGGGVGGVSRAAPMTMTRPATIGPRVGGPSIDGPVIRGVEPHRGDPDRHLRRRIYNACHGDSPPDFCRRIYGDDTKGNLRQRIRYACFSAAEPPVALCRRVYGDRFPKR